MFWSISTQILSNLGLFLDVLKVTGLRRLSRITRAILLRFFDDSSCAGIGVVFRDHMGQIIATPSQRIPLVQTMELAEAMAARHALFCC